MFERYNEKARRSIFFARYEASEFGSSQIESEHLLLGLLRENKGIWTLTLGLKLSEEEIRAVIVDSTTLRDKTSTSVDLPLANECKRILAFGAEEALRSGREHIGSEHLLLGILREQECLAARILRKQGLELKKARTLIAAAKEELSANSGASIGVKAQAALTTFEIAVQIVDATSSETLISYKSHSLIPRIGESLLIRNEQGLGHAYQVQNIVWEFDNIYGFSGIKQVKVFVAKEESI